MPHYLRVGVLAAALLLTTASGASAETLTVKPGDGDCTRGTDNACDTIAKAIATAQANDTIAIFKGTYAEKVATSKPGLQIRGTGPADVKITGSGTGDVVSLEGSAQTLYGVTVDVPSGGGSAVTVSAKGVKVDSVIAQRANGSDANEPVIDVAAGGGLEIVRNLLLQSVGTSTPAIASAATDGITISDTIAVATTGHAVSITASLGNRIVRSTLLSTHAASDGVRLASADAGDKKVVIESTTILGGKDGAGIRVVTSGSTTGKGFLEARHVTVGAATKESKGLVLDSSGASSPATPVPPAPAVALGDVDGKISGSIIRGTAEVKRHAPSVPGVTGAANTATATYTDSDAATPTGNGTVNMNGATQTDIDDKLFQAGSYRLKPDAPVIDRGGPLTGGESTTDVEGDAREVDGPDADTTATSDMGADEYFNKPPKAVFGITNPKPRAGEPTGFISGSSDPDGGGIAEYRWDFGDGKTQTTSIGGVAHAYEQVGTYQVTLTVVDKQGAVSPTSAPQTVTVIDGTRPKVAITAPENNQRLSLTRRTPKRSTRKPRPLQLTIQGTASDESGLQSVEVSLMLVKRDPVKRKRRARRSQTTKVCEHYSGRLLAKKVCTNEIWLKPVIANGKWQIRTRRGLRLPAGRYEIRVRATDSTGLMSTGFTVQERTLVRFRVR